MGEPTAEYRPLPQARGLAETFLAGIREGRLALQRCGGCDVHRYYPRPVCPDCGSEDWAWVDAAGAGTLHSFTVVHRAPIPALKALTPYVLAMIDLDEGARVTSMLVGEDALDAGVGDRVRIEFPQAADGEPGMPVFRRAVA